MPTTPTGFISQPMKLMEDLICASATFRTEVGAANAAAAAAFVFWDEAFPDNDRPWALITDNNRTSNRESTTGWLSEGVIVVQFEFATTFVGDDQDNENAKIFRNKMGAIEAEMKAAVIATPSNYVEIFRIEGPEIHPPNPDGNNDEKFWAGYLAFSYRALG